MSNQPITHIIIDTSSSDENYSGDCDYALIPMTPDYLQYLLWRMEEVRKARRFDTAVYSLECWDASAQYFRGNEGFEAVRDVDGNAATDVPRGEPILLADEPEFDDDDYGQADCLTVQIGEDEVWWSAYVKHTEIRIETAHVSRKTLTEILRRFPSLKELLRNHMSVPVHPALQQIHDLLYLDIQGGRTFCNPRKHLDDHVMAMIAEVVDRFIPKPEQETPA